MLKKAFVVNDIKKTVTMMLKTTRIYIIIFFIIRVIITEKE